jgi:hypothetical protein
MSSQVCFDEINRAGAASLYIKKKEITNRLENCYKVGKQRPTDHLAMRMLLY